MVGRRGLLRKIPAIFTSPSQAWGKRKESFLDVIEVRMSIPKSNLEFHNTIRRNDMLSVIPVSRPVDHESFAHRKYSQTLKKSIDF